MVQNQEIAKKSNNNQKAEKGNKMPNMYYNAARTQQLFHQKLLLQCQAMQNNRTHPGIWFMGMHLLHP